MNALMELPNWLNAPPLEIDQAEESIRLESLRSLTLLDTPPEDRFDRITRLAAEFFGVPISYVALVDENRQWFKSRHGLCLPSTKRSVSFCQYTIWRNEPLVIPDTHLHPIGQNHPLVVGDPFVRFYAGVPLAGPNGKKIGTFCLLGMAPREFDQEQVMRLVTFAGLVEREINLGQVIQAQNELLEARHQLMETQKELQRELADAAKYVRLMLPEPLEGENRIDWHFHPSTQLGGDGLGYRRIDEDRLAIYVLDVTGHGLGSALLAVTALELLRSPVAQVDFSRPAAIIERLNRTFQMKDHAGKFFSVWYGVYSRSERTITYANAGHPPPLLVTHGENGARLTKVSEGGSVLGIFPETTAQEATIPFPPGAELFLFTDGLYELTIPEGGHGSYSEFLAYIEAQVQAGNPVWDRLLHWLDQARDKRMMDDDVTLLRFTTATESGHDSVSQ